MRDRQTCVACGKNSPETETDYTLISAQFGWRLTRHKSSDGTTVVQWRCPPCWREFKRARALAGEPVSSSRSSSQPLSPRPNETPPPARPTPVEGTRAGTPSPPADPAAPTRPTKPSR